MKEKTPTLENLPFEILLKILKYTNVVTISKFNYLNQYFHILIDRNIWLLIDNLDCYTNSILIPNTIFTYNKYRYLIDWSDIILYNQDHGFIIPEHVISWIQDKVDLEIICSYQIFSESLIRQLYNKISWSLLLAKQNVPLDIINYMVTNQSDTYRLSVTDWYNICNFQKIDCQFVDNNLENVEWYPLSCNKNLVCYDFIYKYGNDIFWQEFTKHGIHENILVYFIDKFDFICWNNISRFTQLSESFIETYLQYLDKPTILRYQTIPEKMLIEMVESFNDFDKDFYFPTIATYQKLSFNFIKKYQSYLSLRAIIRNKFIRKSIIHELYSKEFLS